MQHSHELLSELSGRGRRLRELIPEVYSSYWKQLERCGAGAPLLRFISGERALTTARTIELTRVAHR
jgi:hypothetical protein